MDITNRWGKHIVEELAMEVMKAEDIVRERVIYQIMDIQRTD